VVAFVDDGLAFFGMVRLAQIVGRVEQARRQAADLAAARERLGASESLQAAVGARLADVASMAVAAQHDLARDAARARAQIAEAGATAREAVARARMVTADRLSPPGPEPPATPAGGAVIGARLAWAVLVAILFAYTTWGVSAVVVGGPGPRLGALLVAAYALTVALQLRHSGAARDGRQPWAWPVTLGLQAVLTYMFFLPPTAAYMDLPPFLAGSVLLLVPGWWRWAGYAAVAVSWAALYATVPLPHVVYGGAFDDLYQGAVIALFGLLVYALSRLAGLARELEGLRDQLTRMAAVRERLRVARDVHDLLGLGLSAVALKADLITALIGRHDTRAAAEIAAAATIELTADAGTLRLRVSNDGVGQPADRTPAAAAGGGHGLPNLTARMHAAGGQLTASAAGGRFDLTARIPLDGTGLRPAQPPDPSRA